MRSRQFVSILLAILLSSINSAAFGLVQSTSKPVSGPKYSWVVSLYSTAEGDRDQHVCTGALIDDYTVITAAHCLIALSDQDWVIIQGRDKLTDRGRVLTALETKIHPDYDPVTSTNDLAVIYLYYPAYASNHLKLAGTQSRFTTGQFSLFGWGNNENGQLSTELRVAPQKPAPKNSISSNFDSYDPEIQIATRWFDSKRDAYAGACQGDSGGPLVKRLGKVDYLIGVVSYGARICNTSAPTVHTKISAFRSWLTTTRSEMRSQHATKIKISKEPFYLTGGKTLPVAEVTNDQTGASLQTSVQLVTGDLPNNEIDISTLTVNSYLSPQPYGSVSLTASNVGAWDACSMTTSGFIEARLDLDGKLGSDFVWQYGEFNTGCIVDGTEMILVKASSESPLNCKARIQTTSKGPQVWFSAECFGSAKTGLFRMLLADGNAADVEPGSDNWMGPVTLQR
ncbi:MAG: hypothetical protein RIT32_683 [Actinomycetota bacterium]